MAEFPDANSGGLDPSGAALIPVPVWKRVRVWAIVIALYGAIVGMAAAGTWMLRSAFGKGVAFEDRGLHLLWAVGLLLPMFYILRYLVRTRLKTGTWRGTPEYRAEQRGKRRVQCATGTGRSSGKNGLFQYAVKWASCCAMDRDLPISQRAAAWVVLVLYAAGVLAMAALGLICFGAALADGNTMTESAVFIAIGVGVIAWPAITVYRFVRDLRAGKVGATRDEVEQIREQRAMRHQREWQKPLRSKLGSIAVSCVVLAFWWAREVRRGHGDWVGPAIATVPLVYSVWMQFYKPKSVRTQKDNAIIPGD